MTSLGFEKDVELSPTSPTSSDTPSGMGCLSTRRGPGLRWTSRVRSKMKKLFGRKHKDDETASDSSFGRNNRTPQNDNPYAQANADAYANNSYLTTQQSYQQPAGSQSSFRTTQSASPAAGRPGLPSGPRLGGPGRQQPQNSPSLSEPPQYSSASKSGSGYSDEKLGSSAGYGANRYDAGSSAYSSQSNNRYASQRPGGYGGFDDSQNSTPISPPPKYTATRPGGDWGTPPSHGEQDSYADQGDMTEEQLEDAHVKDLKRQAHDIRQQSKRTLDNTILMTEGAIASGEASVQMLKEQIERLGRVEKGTDVAISRAREGIEGTSKLDRLNSTPFFVPSGTRKKRQQEADMQVRRELEDKEAKEETRLAQLERERKIRQAMGAVGKPKLLGAGKADKYTFEDDDGTEAADEEEINAGIDKLSSLTGQLNFQAHAIQAHLDSDPDQISRIAEKVMKADDKVMRTNAKLRQIN